MTWALPWIALAICGCLGVFVRYWISLNLNSETFPAGTLTVNLVGSFAIGFIASSSWLKLQVSDSWRLSLVVGFLGALTTFSSYSFELFTYIQKGKWGLAILYFFLSQAMGLLLCFLGWKVGQIH